MNSKIREVLAYTDDDGVVHHFEATRYTLNSWAFYDVAKDGSMAVVRRRVGDEWVSTKCKDANEARQVLRAMEALGA